ncbi:MAG TPA: metallophosphoesterase family protein [Acidobacteriota bacterium]|nr:metallophosphoesterase family protein [Acidobacteriota bacterium]
MKTLIISDIHSNQEALRASLKRTDWDDLWVLGDLVGYGADPNAVVDQVRELEPSWIVRGNHDKVCCGLEDASHFSDLAREAALWTQDRLSDDSLSYLQALPQGPLGREAWMISHGSPWDEDEYLLEEEQVWPQLESVEQPVCFFGHTHVPALYESARGRRRQSRISDSLMLNLEQETRYFINPGSVGQPRDGDPRGCLGLLDREKMTFEFLKFEYDYESAGEKILRAGLPSLLAHRLRVGR